MTQTEPIQERYVREALDLYFGPETVGRSRVVEGAYQAFIAGEPNDYLIHAEFECVGRIALALQRSAQAVVEARREAIEECLQAIEKWQQGDPSHYDPAEALRNLLYSTPQTEKGESK